MTAPAKDDKEWRIHHPLDTPFALSDMLSQDTSVPVEVTRKLEDQSRIITQQKLALEGVNIAYRDYGINLAVQTGWLATSGYMLRRGYKYSDPAGSMFRGLTQITPILRLGNVAALVGLMVFGTTLYQLPLDVMRFKSAHDAREAFTSERDAAITSYNQILQEHRSASKTV